MPDISMCGDRACPSRETCWRFVAPPDPAGQSFMAFRRPDGEARCGEYWPIYMCRDTACPSRHDCRRFVLAAEAPVHNYVDFWRDDGEGRCRMFWSVQKERSVA